MRQEDGFFKGAGGARIYYKTWLPAGEAKAALLVVHGLAEHSGRYLNVVNHLVPAGYAAYGLDHIGHGKSEGTRVYVDRFTDYTDTLKLYFDMVQQWQPGLPIFLLGHSLGGLIGATYLLDHQAGLAGAVLSGPAVKVPENVTGTTIFMGRLLSALAPKAGLVGLEAAGICRDPAVVTAYTNDPLVCTGKATARLGAEMLAAMQRVGAEAAKITLPILLLQGSADRIVDPAGAQMLYDTVGSTDKTIKIYEGLFHEVFNEPEREQVLQDVQAWLDVRLPSHIG